MSEITKTITLFHAPLVTNNMHSLQRSGYALKSLCRSTPDSGSLRLYRVVEPYVRIYTHTGEMPRVNTVFLFPFNVPVSWIKVGLRADIDTQHAATTRYVYLPFRRLRFVSTTSIDHIHPPITASRLSSINGSLDLR